MTVLSALQTAAVRLMGQRPSVFFAATQKFELELVDLANEVAADIMKSHDWQALTKAHTIMVDGEAWSFPLPADYDRMLVRSDMQIAGDWLLGYRQITDINAFTYRRARDSEWSKSWIIADNKIQFAPTPAEGEITFPYISRNYARSASGAAKAEFTADDDTFVLPSRLLGLGIIWKWRENKKLDFTGDQENFVKAFGEYAGKDGGTRIYRYGGAIASPYALW